MPELSEILETLEDLLHQEIRAVMEFHAEEALVKQCLSGRNWQGLEAGLQTVEAKSKDLEDLDNRRERAWQTLLAGLKVSGKPEFYQVMSLVPAAPRARITDLRRRLKVAVVGLKGLTEGLGDYVNTSSSLIQAAVQEARPSLKGRLYSPQGQIKKTAAASLVLDRQF